MTWNRIAAVASLVLVSGVSGYVLRAHAQQQFPPPCTVVVPAAWGDYAGTSTGSGMVFEDKDGTLRIISELPCELEGSVVRGPHILAVIRRK